MNHRIRRTALLTLLWSGLLIGCSSLAPESASEQTQQPTPTQVPATATPTVLPPPVMPTAAASAAPTPEPSAVALPRTPNTALAAMEPLRNTEIVDRPLRDLRPLTDGTVKYKIALWSHASDWIAATPQDGPGMDAINSVTGEVVRVVSDTFVLEPVWDAGAQPCLLLHQALDQHDQLSRICLPQHEASQPAVVSDGPLLAPALAGDEVIFSQNGQLVRQRLATADDRPQPLIEGGALFTALFADDSTGLHLAWTPLVSDLETVQTFVTPLNEPAPVALSQPDEGLWLPRWSPDGRALVLTSVAGRLVSTSVSGEQRYDLGPGDLPSWSPDGTRIAYGGANAGTQFITRDIHLVDWQGNGPRLRLTDASEIELFVSPSWSPDGTRIACVEIDSGQIMIGEVP